MKSSFIGEFYTRNEDDNAKAKVVGIKKGVYDYGNGLKYEGEFNEEGSKHGFGIYHGKKVRYEGGWCKGKKHGDGKQFIIATGELQKKGHWVNGVF